MKRYIGRLLMTLLILAIVAVFVNICGRRLVEKENTERNVVVGRINSEITEKIMQTDYTFFKPEGIVEDVFYSRKSDWEKLYGSEQCPKDVTVTMLDGKGLSFTGEIIEIGGSDSMIRGIYTLNGYLIGFAEYDFYESEFSKLILLMNLAFFIAALIVIFFGIFIFVRIIVPFNRISEYPEKISKGGAVSKLPETKDKYFGKYIWSMNMLSDTLENERKTIQRISDEHQKLVTVLVHGIKTPAANIKLYSEAIATGLYDPEGNVNEKDAEIAGKIEKNADEIERIVSQAVDTANATIFEYDPDVKPFYRHEIEKYIREEYSNSLKVGRIAFDVEAEGDPLINSDLDGVCRIIRQLMDNAIKYGDGTGIVLKMKKTEEGHFITIADNGMTLSESELPFVFNNHWRGSNSTDVQGSGIGLYEARYIARKLGGDIRMKIDKNVTEVTVFIPLN